MKVATKGLGDAKMSRTERNAANMQDGYYTLTKDVTNPEPDGRSRDLTAAPVFPKGSQWEVRQGVVRRFRGVRNLKTVQVDAIRPFLRPAKPTAGHYVQWPVSGEELVAMAVEMGALTVDQVKEMADWLKKMPWQKKDKLVEKHWLKD